MKLNKQVNKIPWLSVTQECGEVDRRELICVPRVVICVADVLDPQEGLKSRPTLSIRVKTTIGNSVFPVVL